MSGKGLAKPQEVALDVGVPSEFFPPQHIFFFVCSCWLWLRLDLCSSSQNELRVGQEGTALHSMPLTLRERIRDEVEDDPHPVIAELASVIGDAHTCLLLEAPRADLGLGLLSGFRQRA